MSFTRADVLFLELIDDSTSNSIDQVHCYCWRIIDLAWDNIEHVWVEIFVEQLTILTKRSWKDVFGIWCCVLSFILSLDVNDLVLISKTDSPDTITREGLCVDSIARDLASLFTNRCEVERCISEISCIIVQYCNLSFSVFGNAEYDIGITLVSDHNESGFFARNAVEWLSWNEIACLWVEAD